MEAVALVDAVADFDKQEQSNQGAQLAARLMHGFTLLRNLMFTRVHEDVEQKFGRDSISLPYSFLRTVDRTRLEIDVFQIATSACYAEELGYVRSGRNWFADWLVKVRFREGLTEPALANHLERYLARKVDERRLMFSDILVKTFPEAERAPLVLYRLFPLSVAVGTAVAFGDHLGAAELRNRQIRLLPAILDCEECHGRPLENGEKCAVCGNPVWNYTWLTDVD